MNRSLNEPLYKGKSGNVYQPTFNSTKWFAIGLGALVGISHIVMIGMI